MVVGGSIQNMNDSLWCKIRTCESQHQTWDQLRCPLPVTDTRTRFEFVSTPPPRVAYCVCCRRGSKAATATVIVSTSVAVRVAFNWLGSFEENKKKTRHYAIEVQQYLYKSVPGSRYYNNMWRGAAWWWIQDGLALDQVQGRLRIRREKVIFY